MRAEGTGKQTQMRKDGERKETKVTGGKKHVGNISKGKV